VSGSTANGWSMQRARCQPPAAPVFYCGILWIFG